MKKIKKTQWHPAFCSAIRLELREDKEFLEYFNEYNLNTKPLQIDLLIIKKLCKKEEKELADSVLQVAMMENREVFEETKKDGDYMCEALRELFRDEIEAEKARARREGRAEERAVSQNIISKLQEQIELLNQTVIELKNKLSKLEEA
mgnify:CR=1 FL=1